MGSGSISRLRANSWLTDRPACAYPISLKTMPKPVGVSRPRFSESAICQISPSTSDDNLVFSKKVTALSPVTTPILSESARENRWPKTRRSSGERWRFGSGWVSHVDGGSREASIISYAVDSLRRCRPCWNDGKDEREEGRCRTCKQMARTPCCCHLWRTGRDY